MTKLSMEWKRLCKIKAKVQKYQSQSQYRRISSQTGAGTEEYCWMQSAKTAKTKVVLQKIKKTRAKTANRVDIAFKLYNFRGPNCILPPKSLLSHPKTQLQL
ncbi:hypothetical protein Tco_0040981, partial [Tanacetum coccineum]